MMNQMMIVKPFVQIYINRSFQFELYWNKIILYFIYLIGIDTILSTIKSSSQSFSGLPLAFSILLVRASIKDIHLDGQNPSAKSPNIFWFKIWNQNVIIINLLNACALQKCFVFLYDILFQYTVFILQRGLHGTFFIYFYLVLKQLDNQSTWTIFIHMQIICRNVSSNIFWNKIKLMLQKKLIMRTQIQIPYPLKCQKEFKFQVIFVGFTINTHEIQQKNLFSIYNLLSKNTSTKLSFFSIYILYKLKFSISPNYVLWMTEDSDIVMLLGA